MNVRRQDGECERFARIAARLSPVVVLDGSLCDGFHRAAWCWAMGQAVPAAYYE
jgi:hypothetical protein